MNNFVSIASRDKILVRIKELLKQRSLILLWGRSGSGKSFLLEKLAKDLKALKFTQVFDSKEFQNKIETFLTLKEKPIILLDEVSLYEDRVLELLRIYSDELSFVLSSHKKLKIFKQEYFKSRFNADFELKKLKFEELDFYLKNKYNLTFSKQNLKMLYKFYQGNLRNIDKILKSFNELKSFYQNSKTNSYVLKLAALEQNLLR